MVLSEFPASWVSLENLALRERRETKEREDVKVVLDNRGRKEREEMLEFMGSQELKASKPNLDLKVRQDPMETRVLKEGLESKESKEKREVKLPAATKESKGCEAPWVRPVLLDVWESQASRGSGGIRVQRVTS